MIGVATYVFVDLETTGLPVEETNRTKITELSMVAVKREHLLRTIAGAAPRVQNKLTLCFNPCRLVHPGSTATTGLCNDLLEHETKFDKNAFTAINSFLNILAKPVCLVAQNGHNFDFPIIKNHLEKLSVQFTDDLLCADCLHAFYDILEKVKISQNYTQDLEEHKSSHEVKENSNVANPQLKEKKCDDVDIQILMQKVNETTPQQEKIKNDKKPEFEKMTLSNVDYQISMQNANETTPRQQMIKFDGTPKKLEKMNMSNVYIQISMQKVNETTPQQQKIKNNETQRFERKNLSKVRRRFPWSKGSKPKDSYKLKNIYERVLNRPGIEAHRAENDCIMALEVSAALAKEFVKWVDENHCLFADVKPMTIGVPLGLLVLTGILWGCTNPFIRRGTKGLRSVRADTKLGQAYAEIVFLLGNWRYVAPFLVNQCGSLVYLMAVQRAPLSLAVPASNSLAFAFTAITGSAVGAEEPLDRGSIVGILLIIVGTALCCWDKSY